MTIDDHDSQIDPTLSEPARPRGRRAASRPAGPPVVAEGEPAQAAATPAPMSPDLAEPTAAPEVVQAPAAPRRRTRKAPVAAILADPGAPADLATQVASAEVAPDAEPTADADPPARRRRARKTAAAAPEPMVESPSAVPVDAGAGADAGRPATESDTEPAAAPTRGRRRSGTFSEPIEVPATAVQSGAAAPGAVFAMPLFQAPDPDAAPPRRRRAASRPAGPPVEAPATPDHVDEVDPSVEVDPELADPELAEPDLDEPDLDEAELADGADDEADGPDDGDPDGAAARRRRRRRGGRGRRGRTREDAEAEAEAGPDVAAGSAAPGEAADAAEAEEDEEQDDEAEGSTGSRRRRRRRRRGGASGESEASADDPPNTVVRVRESRRSGGGGSDDVTGLRGSTRLEAKKMRRREGREAGRRRPVITEAEFLARREAVERVMIMREKEGRTQIGVLEDGVLVEHYVARRTQTSSVGNVYLGRVQNVLPSMEAAFVDVGKGRNAVLYAGEVNWDAAGLEGQPKRIEHALKSGEAVLVQVTKDPIGHKGARLTSQISLPGRYLVYVPDGSMTGISRKLPDTERARLKRILQQVVPDHAGVIVRTAAEGASEEELKRDVARLQAQWEDISRKAGAVNAPALLYGEPDLAIRVVRDIFNEDFAKLIVSGDDTWDVLHAYIGHVAPDLVERLEKWDGAGDVFAAHRIDEQLAKALDRKVWLPSGGSLVIDRTEAMTVVDVNTGKFTGSGGNLEETVTKNNIEAAEEIVRQLRLRDIGGIIVVDFIDMVLESNRELVLRRLLECLGRDRTKHQVAEVTSLGLVQMTRKRVGQGLLEVFSETCEHCGGRGIILHDEPVEKREQSAGGSGNGSGSGSGNGSANASAGASSNGSGAASGSGGGGRSRGRGRGRGSSGGGGDAAVAVAASGG